MLTIFTPTYNRKQLLKRVYESLCTQTSKEFVWLIIDDGSTDGTEEEVRRWQQEQKVQIRYQYQENAGKMQAHNHAVELTDTELFLCLDSDDFLVNRAVELICQIWDSVKDETFKKGLAGIVAEKGRDEEHTLNGQQFPEVSSITLTGLYQKGFCGETALVFRTAVLREYPFPVFPGEKFVPEAVVYDEIDKRYRLKVLPQILMVCEYQEDGLTKDIEGLRRRNPRGWQLYYQKRIRNTPVSVLRYKYIAHAICFTWALSESVFEQVPASKAEVIAAIPAACLLKLVGKL